MLTHPHMTVACHLLAARHFGSRHLHVGQAGKGRGADPEANKAQRYDMVQSRHSFDGTAFPDVRKGELRRSRMPSALSQHKA